MVDVQWSFFLYVDKNLDEIWSFAEYKPFTYCIKFSDFQMYRVLIPFE